MLYGRFLFINEFILNDKEIFSEVAREKMKNRYFRHKKTGLIFMRYVKKRKNRRGYAYTVIDERIIGNPTGTKWCLLDNNGHITGKSFLLHRVVLLDRNEHPCNGDVHHLGHTFDNRYDSLIELPGNIHDHIGKLEGHEGIKRIDEVYIANKEELDKLVNHLLSNDYIDDSRKFVERQLGLYMGSQVQK